MKVGIIRKITGFFNARIRKINKFINEYGNNDKYEQELNYIIRKGSIVMYPSTYKHPVFGDTPSLRKALLLGEKNDI